VGRGRITIKARPRGVDRIVRRFSTTIARLPEDVLGGQKELGRRAEVAFGAHAPHRTGRLIRGITSIVLGGTVIVKDEARNPATGYDYVGVTRFGHKAARIYPKHSATSTVATGKARGGALRFVIGGKVLFRASVAGYHPDHDWAEEALPEVQAQAQVVASRLGQSIQARF
jgi:hypothetical protein